MIDRIEHAVFWHLHPLGFVGAERRACDHAGLSHRLGHIVDWLDYAVELGVSALLLGPIFASSSHGYDTVDPFRIDPRLGDEADFDELVATARRRGLAIVLDGVFNHVGRDFPIFRAALERGPGCSEAEWFRLAWRNGPDREPDWATFEGHRDLVALNHDSPLVVDHVVRVMTRWLDRGVSGWRLDAAYSVPTRFWAEVLPRVRDRHPEAFVFGEVIHGDYAGFVRTSGVDAVTQYELWKAIWSSIVDRNLFELAWALERHDRLLDTCVPVTFVGNHDVTRIASRIGDDRLLPHALVVLFTVAGIPCVYAGDEQAFRGIKEDRAGGDDAVRPAFPADPSGLAPFGWPVYRLHQLLIGLRRRHPWLHRGRTRVLHRTNRQMVYETAAQGRRLTVALNLDDAPADLEVPDLGAVLAGSGAESVARGGRGSLRLAGHGWAVAVPAGAR